MIKCIAVDDEPLALKKLASYITRMPDLELAAQCQSVAEAREALDQQDIGAIFLDINMPDVNGMDFAQSIGTDDMGNKPLIVFTTAYSEFAVEGYKTNAVGYLLKPYGFDEFEATVNKLKQVYVTSHQAAAQVSHDADDDGIIFVKSDYKIVRISVEKIRYIEAMSEYLRIYCVDRERPVVVLLSMKKIEEHLPEAAFMRIHRSYIINVNAITEVQKNHVMLGDDTSLPIGDFYKETFMNYLNSKMLSK